MKGGIEMSLRKTITKKAEKILTKIERWMLTKIRQPQAKGHCSTRNAWIAAGIMALLSVTLIVYGAQNSGVSLFCALLFWLGIRLKEIKDPYVGLLFQMGKLMGQLSPGWHLSIPFYQKIEIRTTETLQIKFQEEMYYQGKKPINVRGVIYYKMVNVIQANTISEETAETRIKKVSLSKLKWGIGKKSFEELLREGEGIEETVLKQADNELENDGYTITGVEIDDLKEETESVAAVKKEIGFAEAEVDGKKAKAVADVLRGNYPAAIAMSISTIADKIISEFFKASQRKTRTSQRKIEAEEVKQNEDA